MAKRRFPILVATRLTRRQTSLVKAAADVEGVTVSTLLRDILMPEVSRRISASAAEIVGGETP